MQPPDTAEVQHAVGERYEVLGLVGAGGMGFVYRARHRALGHIVAVKILPPQLAATASRLTRCQQEAALAASLSHPHLVPVYDFGSREGITFLIMPFVRGTTFESVLATSRPTLAASLRVVQDVGAALDYAHGRGVVHRDVKPSNILIDEDSGRALLADFGVAHVVRVATSALTAPGVAIGTPGYMAPEQEAGSEHVDGRADLYALAIVAFEALTGTKPAGGTDLATLARTLRGGRRELSAAVAAALVAPLAVRPDNRPGTAAAWLAAWDRAGKRAWWRWGGAGVAAAVALTGTGWSLCRAHILLCRTAAIETVAVMPFDKLGETLPDRQLMESFARRLSAAPKLDVLSGARVYTEAVSRYGAGALSNPEADTLAKQLGAKFFIQPSVVFTGTRSRLTARLYRARSGDVVAEADVEGSVDSLADMMTSVGEKLLHRIIPAGRTCPVGFRACAAHLKADEAFRRGDYERARALYDEVVAGDSDFAPAYFGRLLVVGQTNPSEETLRQTITGARLHGTGLERSDSLLLAGYVHLLERGDGYRALEDFQLAKQAAPDQPYVRFVLGEFYLYFGALFEQRLPEAKAEFDSVLTLDPKFAPAVANSISLAHLPGGRGDSARARIARAVPGSAGREGDAWIVLARVIRLDSLGDGRSATSRLSAWAGSAAGGGDAAAHWILARAGRDPGAHALALHRLARPDSAPLPVSLSLDLDARARLGAADTTGALALWDRATRRYAVLSAPFDLVASLWPLRLEQARLATARGDTAAARRACDSFDALVGYVDQVALPQIERACRPHQPQ